MYRPRLALFGVAALAAACSGGPADDSVAPVGTAVLFEGARLIPGDGSAPIEQAAFVVDSGMITQLGSAGQLDVPAGVTHVDLTGKTVMPALIGAHGHVGYQTGLTFDRENYTRESIYHDLRRATYFGLGTVMTMGIDTDEFVYQIRGRDRGWYVRRCAPADRGQRHRRTECGPRQHDLRTGCRLRGCYGGGGPRRRSGRRAASARHREDLARRAGWPRREDAPRGGSGDRRRSGDAGAERVGPRSGARGCRSRGWRRRVRAGAPGARFARWTRRSSRPSPSGGCT